MAESDAIEIRPLRSYDELEQAQDLQNRVWKTDDNSDSVPATILLPISKNSGVVLGAFDGERLVGVCFGFLGRTPDGRMEHWSHITGVLEEERTLGVGERLKWAQREAVLAMGVDLIRWTMDPLEGINASLNFRKLGVTCRTYQRNVYGVMQDALNAGIESDRFIIDWEINSERVKTRRAEGKPTLSARALAEGGVEIANLTEAEAEGIRRTSEIRLNLESPQILTETPASYQAVKAHDLDLAIAWRMQTHELFETYFGRGYVAMDFLSELWDGERRNFYLLERA